jgi:signal transduction histidine kinase
VQLSGLRLDDLLAEVQGRLADVAGARDRLRGLLDAVLVVASGLELEAMLGRICSAAAELVEARYGALGVLNERGGLGDFVYAGIDTNGRAKVLREPDGLGLLGTLIEDPRPLLRADLSRHPAWEGQQVGKQDGQPDGRPPVPSFLGVPIRVRDKVFGNLYLTEKRGGSQFTADDEAVVQALAAAAGMAIDNARLFEETRRRQRWLEATGEITTELLSGIQPEDVLPLVAISALELVGADCTVIALPCPVTDDLLVARVAEGVDAELISGIGLPATDSIAGQVFRSGTALAFADLSAVREAGPLAATGRFGPALFVPLRAGEQANGTLIALRSRGGEPFRPDQLPVAVSFADQAALALEFAAKQRVQRELAVLADRDRIARDLHDHVIQRLFAIGLVMQGVQRQLPTTALGERLGRAVEQLDHTISEIRTTILELHATEGPDSAQNGGLRRRLLSAITDLTSEAELKPTVRMSGPLDTMVPAAVAEHVEAVLREAVSNAVRHANADRLVVTVDVADDITVEVVDDGVGIPAHVGRSGLHNVAHRAEALGGELRLARAGDHGTRLTWRAPLP